MVKGFRIDAGVAAIPPHDRPGRIDPHPAKVEKSATKFPRVVEGGRQFLAGRDKPRQDGQDGKGSDETGALADGHGEAS